MIAELVGSLIASIYGGYTCFQKKIPLFYRIVVFSALTSLLGNVYTVLYEHLWQPAETGFHIGYLGYVGMFFFLYSSYYGALDNLADGKQPELRRFRVAAGIAAAAFFVGSVLLLYFGNKAYWMYIVLIPMSFTVYFAVKHLIIPDIEMGIIKVMRLYNALVVGICVCMLLRFAAVPDSMLETLGGIGTGILLSVCLPVARNGVRKWFI